MHQPARHSFFSSRPAVIAATLALCIPAALSAQQAKVPTPLDAKSRMHAPFHVATSGVAPGPSLAAEADVRGWEKYVADHGPQAIYLDPFTGRPMGVSGAGIPWIPGRGNALTPQDLINRGQLAANAGLDIGVLEKIARKFLADNAALVRIPAGMELRLSPAASHQVTDSMWAVWFNLYYQGLAIPGGSVNFVVKHGNLILWGTHNLDDITALPRPTISETRAVALAGEHAGGYLPGRDAQAGAPTPVLLFEQDGNRHGYRQVWEVRFQRVGEGNYLARVDAHTGEILEFIDENDYAQVKGGIYPVSNLPTGTEVSRPLGFANYGTGLYADAGGSFPYAGGTVTSTLAGKYVTISDKCGAISLSASAAPGDLDFSSNTGTNCTTPGVGGIGNTNSARSCYFHTDLIKQKGRVQLPTNTWLQGNLAANVNINSVCNAFWTSAGGGSVNFYRQGASGTTVCGNTGEIAGVFLHEWGHGMDFNDGNGAQGSGEAMGDTVAMLQLRNSCIGNGFWLSTRGCGGGAASGYNCSGYGNCCTGCSGVRDQDYQKHASSTILTPANIAAACASTGTDPCGREVHCEAALAGNTVWDMAFRDLPARADLGVEDAWNLADKLWWESGPTRTAGYTCTNKTGAPWNNGCAATTWYQTFLAADDDNGNLADGTPHATTLFQSFDRHGISCGVATDAANKDFTTCPVIGSAGTLSGTAGPNQAVLNWTLSATNGASVSVKRNNLGCAFSFTKIASVSPITTKTYTDTGASGGNTWYYIVQPIGANVDCLGPASNCVSVTPTVSTCSAPTGVNAPTVADVSACAATGITVTWTAPTAWGDTSGTRTWNVLRDGAAIAAGPCSGALPGTTLSCVDTPGDALAHTYSVMANNGCGLSTTSVASASVTDVNNSPSAPTAVSATTSNCADITTTWTAGAGSTSSNLLRYAGACPSVTGLVTFTGVTSPYVDTTATSGSSYCIVARAVNACGNADAAGVTGTRGALPATPAAPTATATCAGINLSWTAVAGATSYNVLRSSGTCGTATLLASGIAVTSYSDATAVAGTSYVYSLQAVGGCGTSGTSTCSAGAIRPATPAPTVTGGPSGCSPVALSTQLFTTYQWQLGGVNIGGATAQNYGATASGSYTVAVTNAGGCSGTSPAVAITVNTVPAAPVQSAPAAGNNQVTTNWALSGGATGYQVQRGNAGGPYANIGPLQGAATTSYLDSGLTNGTQYCYVIAASNGCGASGNSNEQCATPNACVPNVRLNDNLEGGIGNWTIAGTWATSTTVAGSATTSLRGSDPGNNPNRNTCRTATTAAAIAIPAAATGAQLRFWSQVALAADDNGVVQTSTDGGATWNKLTTVNYPGAVGTAPTATCTTLLSADPAFSGTVAGKTYAANLSAFAGQSLLLRFTLVTGGTASASSFWYVDDVRVTDGNGIASAMTILGQSKSGSDLVQQWAAGSGLENYFVYRNTVANPASWGGAISVPSAAATGWTDLTQLSSLTSQFYTVTAYNGCVETAK